MNSIQDFEELYRDYVDFLTHNTDTLKRCKIDTQKPIKSLNSQIEYSQIKRFAIEARETELNRTSPAITVGVVGGFSTGKSSFVNSLIGHDFLGVKLRPATAKVTRLVYGKEFVVKMRTKTGITKTVSLDYYKSIVDHSSSMESNKNQDVEEFVISVPSKILTEINIIDTPGFSSTSALDDELTKKMIKELDVLIWLFDANKVGDKAEIDLLNTYKNKVIIAVINKIDLKAPSQRLKLKEELTHAFPFKEVLFYSAETISKRNKALREQNDFFKTLFPDLKHRISQGENINFSFENEKFNLCINGVDEKEYKLKVAKDDKFSEYQELLKKEFKTLALDKLTYQKKKLSQDKDELSTRYLSDLNARHEYQKYLINVLKQEKTAFEKQKEKSRASFKKKVNSYYNKFIPEFFAKTYKHIFSFKTTKGFFSDDHDIRLKKVNWNSFRKKVYDFYYDFTIKVITDIYMPILKEVGNDDDFAAITEDETELLGELLDQLALSTAESIYGLCNSIEFNTGKFDIDASQKSDYESKIKNWLDLVTPDEVLLDMVLMLLDREMKLTFDWDILNPLNKTISELGDLEKRFQKHIENIN